MFNLLNELHERGFYKRLLFYYGDFLYDQNGIDQLGSVNGLAKLAISHSDQIKLCALNFRLLRCSCCDGSDHITNLEMNCTSLEQIVFEKAHPDHILMLCGRAAHLEIIVVSHITTTNYADRMSYGTVRGGFNSGNMVLNLPALEMERRRLHDARKFTIYVPEKVFLKTKWTLARTDFELIRLMRIESLRKDDNFDISIS